MRLYSGLSTDFIRDIPTAFFPQYLHNLAPSEVNSSRNWLRAVSQVIDDAGFHDHGILLEYQPRMSSKRLDSDIPAREWRRCSDPTRERCGSSL